MFTIPARLRTGVTLCSPFQIIVRTPFSRDLAARLSAMSKCLAQRNKTRRGSKATNKRPAAGRN